MAAHQAPPSLGFSRQEHWSGLPFTSPFRESEKWKWSRSVVSDSLRPHGLQPTRLLHPWDSLGKSSGVACHCLLRMEYYSAIKSDEVMLCAIFWKNQGNIMLSERSQTHKSSHVVWLHLHEISSISKSIETLASMGRNCLLGTKCPFGAMQLFWN